MEPPKHLKETPFLPYYKKGVADWLDVFGFAVPLTWGDVAAEYAAIREHAAALEFSMLLKFDVEGRGAVATVNKVFSRDVGKLAPGKIAYGVVVTEDGMMADDCTVFMHGDEHVRVIGANPQVGNFLKAHALPGVTVTERRDSFAQLSLQGPNSREILGKLTKTDVGNAALPYYNFVSDIELAGIRAQVSRIGFTGELGYEIMIPVEKAGDLWAALNDAGKAEGLLPAGGAALMTCRIETGLIMGGLDYTDQTSPYECRMGWAVDLEKGDFQGRSALVKLKDAPRTRVVSVVLPASDTEFGGVKLMHGGKEAGAISMAVPSPYLQGNILGFATVNAAVATVGTVFELDGHDGVSAKIVRMPVYDPGRVRVKS
jgi:aminomethyltransferase